MNQEHPHLYGPDMQERDPDRVLPFAPSLLEGWLLPQDRVQPQGSVYLAIVLGWSIRSFWDRSVSRSISSTSAFVLDGVPAQVDGRGFQQALTIAKDAFPRVLKRLPFQLASGAVRSIVPCESG